MKLSEYIKSYRKEHGLSGRRFADVFVSLKVVTF